MTLAIVRLWLKLNHVSIGCVIFCTFENSDYEIRKDLISNRYFPVSKYHLTNTSMKKKLKYRLCCECEKC